MRKIFKQAGKTIPQPKHFSSEQPNSTEKENLTSTTPEIVVSQPKKPKKRKEKKEKSQIAKHLDRVLLVSALSLILLMIVFHLERKNQILEKIQSGLKAQLPMIFS